ncbi:MAG: phosphatidate cytidylyltransferase [Myxococcota bacterium]|nr:phosphatidate cytidylyltransferase [Myxococcota bacterium]
MLKTRILSAAVFAPALLGVVYVGGLWLHGVCALLALLAFWELSRMFGIAERPFEALVGYLGTSAIAGSALGYIDNALAILVLVSLLAFLAVLKSPAPLEGAHHRVSNLLLAMAYAGVLLPMLGRLRDMDEGLGFCLAAIFCTWGSDTGAYFAGKALGKRKLFELVSPKKTLEGAIGGVICGGLVGLIVQQLFAPSLSQVEAFGLGVIAAVVGAIGDLGESLLKRSTGIKDSSQLIPGHGGVLDRFDGVMFSAGAVYLYLTLF